MSSICIPVLNLNMTKVFNFLKSIEKFDYPSQKPENHSKFSCLPVSFIFKFKNFILLLRSLPSPLPFTEHKYNSPIIVLFNGSLIWGK